MIKWLSMLMGVVILLIIGIFFYDMWFNPNVPFALQQGNTTVILSESEQSSQTTASVASPTVTPPTTDANGTAQITLTSLQDMESSGGAPPPALTNPQGNKTATANHTVGTVQPTVTQPVAKTPEVVSPVQTASPAVLESVKSTGKATAWVQAGSFGDRENANNLAASLQKQGMSVDIETATVNGRRYNRVYVGPLTEAQVDNTLQKLSKMGINARQTNR